MLRPDYKIWHSRRDLGVGQFWLMWIWCGLYRFGVMYRLCTIKQLVVALLLFRLFTRTQYTSGCICDGNVCLWQTPMSAHQQTTSLYDDLCEGVENTCGRLSRGCTVVADLVCPCLR